MAAGRLRRRHRHVTEGFPDRLSFDSVHVDRAHAMGVDMADVGGGEPRGPTCRHDRLLERATRETPAQGRLAP